MAVTRMQKLSVTAHRNHRKEILEALQRMGVMEIETDAIDDESLKKLDTTEARMSFLKRSDVFEGALAALDRYAPEKKGMLDSLAGKELLSKTTYESVVRKKNDYAETAALIVKKDKEISELQGRILKNEARKELLQPWMSLEVPMDFRGTAKTEAYIGTLPGTYSEANLAEVVAEGVAHEGALNIDILTAAKDATYISVLCLKDDAEKVFENLRNHGFARPAQIETGVPKDIAAEIDRDLEGIPGKIDVLKNEIAEYSDKREAFKILSDYYQTRAEKYRMLATIPQTDNAFFLQGWVPADQVDNVTLLLTEKFDADVEVEETPDGVVPPTLLHNNKFSRSVEPVLESYGLPTKGHVDPTFIVSIFYVIFFGMMLSDAGYGIIIFVACAIVLKKYPGMAEGMKKTLQLFFWCGLSTTFWGFMYGGFFGDLIQVVAENFFGWTGGTILKPLWFEPLKNPMRLLMFCLLVGVIHLMVGMAIKGYEAIKEGDIVGAVSDVLAWMLLVIGLILILLPTELFASIAGRTYNLPPAVQVASKIMAAAGAVIILFMSGRSNKNWALRIGLGAYDIYGITSWLSDILSYSRLLALGLATGVIASVVNMLALMVSKGVIGKIAFVVILLLGHTLNLAINLLGAYVHTNRLQFAEFFGKFYDAGGVPFQPFKESNKYTDIKEERTL